MKILQILHNKKVGGAEQHLIQLCDALQRRGHAVEAAAVKSSWIGQRLTEMGIKVHNFDPRSHFDPVALVELISLLRSSAPDIVHTHLVRGAYYARFATRLAGTPLVSTVHDLTTWKHYSRRRQLIAVSNAVKANLLSRGFDDAMIKVVYPGARDCSMQGKGASTRQTMRGRLGLNEQDTAIFLIGRVAEVKGHDIALKAMARVRQVVGSTAKLYFAGQETSWGSKLKEVSGASEARWLGRVENIPELLSAADICIQPSRSEGLPLALMEAASASKALIGSYVGGIPEVIDNGLNGLLVPPENSDALAEAIIQLLRMPEQAKELGNQARKKYEQYFSVDNMADQVIGVYLQCMKTE